MGSTRDIRFKNYCNSMYNELSGMKSRLLDFVREIEQMTGPEREKLDSHIPHFRVIADFIDWKLEILTKVCPFEWTGYTGVERTVSVLPEKENEKETVSGGYIGG